MDERELPTTPGAYVLFIGLERAVALGATSLDPRTLAPGRYVYCGSAYGPGGLGARLRRHLRTDKAVRWHVDHLTAAGRIFALGLAPGGRECALVEGLGRQAGITAEMLPHTVLPEYLRKVRELAEFELELFEKGILPRAGAALDGLVESASELSETLVLVLRRKVLRDLVAEWTERTAETD